MAYDPYLQNPSISPTDGTDWQSTIDLQSSRAGAAKIDWRARIRPKRGGEDYAYGLAGGNTGSPSL